MDKVWFVVVAQLIDDIVQIRWCQRAELPEVDRLRIRDSVIGYRRSKRKPFNCQVAEAMVKNDPKQPEQTLLSPTLPMPELLGHPRR